MYTIPLIIHLNIATNNAMLCTMRNCKYNQSVHRADSIVMVIKNVKKSLSMHTLIASSIANAKRSLCRNNIAQVYARWFSSIAIWIDSAAVTYFVPMGSHISGALLRCDVTWDFFRTNIGFVKIAKIVVIIYVFSKPNLLRNIHQNL